MDSTKRQILLITVIVAAIMELIDISIVNVALSHMSGNLGATLEDTSWVITAYAIANVIIIPMTSFLTTNLGRRNYYISSVLLFTFCSFMCGHSSNIWMLVFFRFLQGIGGGALISVSQAVVFELFPKEKQGTASAIFGLGIFIGPTIGPTLGGFITEDYSWPWIFFINIPIGIMVAVSCWFLLTEPVVKPVVKAVDWLGIALLAVGIGALQIVLERGQIEDWFETGYITAFSIVAALSLISFIFWELHTPNPVVNLRVLKSRTLSIAAILTFIVGIGMFTSVFMTPVLAQRLLNFSPTQTGMLLLPGAIIALFVLMLSGKLLQRGISPIYLIIVGFLIFIYFSWQMTLISINTSKETLAINLIFRAIGMALLTVPTTMLAVSTLDPADIPQGAALNNMMRQLGGSFGISLANTYLARRFAEHRVDFINNITSTNILATERLNRLTGYFQSKGYDLLQAKQKALALTEYSVSKQSTLLSYMDTYLLIGLLFAFALPLLFFVKSKGTNAVKLETISDH
ncbi:DHA2 family multidrug resistance protein [Flavobacterium sp. 270]|uniref:DHA2 family efflux MFS transporter permease subunit n=1 Tax=Flavobacterium sp. 270 TaxID=2512114 RepID=UPI001065B022|nr:DHA2 family efflux MFS transporter permease subunit [Flavobacterium sp. 270]TDW51674.1 DHA2 family multidrug resistance protein [Flavobacterium sp. 270]